MTRIFAIAMIVILAVPGFALSGFAVVLTSDAYPTVSNYTYTNSAPNGHTANDIVVYLPGIGETTLQKALLQNTSGPVREVGTNFYLNLTGNFGIGTTNPGAKLDVVDSASAPATGTAIIESTGGNANFVIKAANTASYAYATFFQGSTGQFEMGIVPTTADFYMNTNVQSGSSGSSVFIKKSNGYVGIGTTNPSSRLTVGGVVESTSGGFKFPDGTTQTTAAVTSSANTTSTVSSGYIVKSTGSSTLGNSVVYETSGKVGVNTTSPNYALQVGGDVAANAYWYTSDARMKKNIVSLNDQQMLDKVLQLNPVTFDWKASSTNNDAQIGLIAQDVEKVLPQLVHTAPDGTKSVEYGNVVAPLIAAIQAQQQEIDQLKAQVAALSAQQSK